MPIETLLLTYGPLGAWTAWLVMKDMRSENKTRQVIENNTIVMTRFLEKTEGCPGRKP